MPTTLTQEILDSENFSVFTTILAKKVQDYFQTPEHRKAFENWYRERYGKEYVWR